MAVEVGVMVSDGGMNCVPVGVADAAGGAAVVASGGGGRRVEVGRVAALGVSSTVGEGWIEISTAAVQ